jgi:dihydrodipicolinate synthase/N-acetylneuraminate lyase
MSAGRSRFGGVWPALTTPFDQAGRLDLDRLAEHVSWLIEEKVAGVVPCGSLGEYETLSEDERRSTMKVVVEAASGRVPVVPGISGRSAAEARKWAEYAAELGCEAAMCLPPTSHSPTDDEVVAHFEEVSKAGIAIIAYNNPFSTRVDMRPGLLARLQDATRVTAVKEFSQDVRRVAQIRRLAPGLEVICGCDDLVLEAVFMGATGWIAGFANVLPRACVTLFSAAAEGQWERARSIYEAMLPLLAWDADPRFVQAVKTAQEVVGVSCGPVRLPRLALPDSERAEVEWATRRAAEVAL